MNDLRSRIAAVVERDRRRRMGNVGEGGSAEGPRATGARPKDGGSPARKEGFGAAARVTPFEVREQRFAIDDLGLEIVGRGAPDPLLIAHLGLKGEAPGRWQDVLWLDTETTGLAGGTGTYVFLLGIAYFCEAELVLRQRHVVRLAIGAQHHREKHGTSIELLT